MRNRSLVTTACLVVVGVAALAACSSATTGGGSSAASSAAASSTGSIPPSMAPSVSPSGSSSAMPGSNPGTWTPVTVTPAQDGSIVRLKLHQAVIFSGFGDTATYTSSSPAVFTVHPAGTSGGVTTTAGGQVVGQGDSNVTITNGTKTYTIQISAIGG